MKKNLTTGQADPNQDQSIVAFQLIHALYCSKLLNAATYANIKKQFGSAITESQVSSDFLDRFRSELIKQTGRPKKDLLELPGFFLRAYPQISGCGIMPTKGGGKNGEKELQVLNNNRCVLGGCKG